jgi:hypothetical protein
MTFYRRLYCLCILLFFTGSIRLCAQNKRILDQQLSINIPADSLILVLNLLESKTKCSFAYDPDQLRDKKTAAFHFSKTPLSRILDQLLFGTKLGFKVVGSDIVIAPVKPTTGTIRGHVRDESSGEELIGATLYIPELGVGINTNQYGFYAISVPEGVYQVQISNTGYQTKEEKIRLYKDLQLEIELRQKTNRLEEAPK